MLSRFRKESAPIELYGKLPIAKDYLRIGGGKGAGLALRDWLDQGFSSRAERDDRPSVAWPAGFMVGGYSGDPIMGTIWPSSDSGGLRPFPFASFTARRRRMLGTEWSTGPGQLAPIWERLAGIYTAHRSYRDGQTFLMAMRGQTLDMEGLMAAPEGRLDFDAWVEALWPETGVEGLVDTLASVGRAHAAGKKEPIRLPLVSNAPTAVQTHAWAHALCELGVIARGDVPTVFFPLMEPEAIGEQPAAPAFAVFFVTLLRPEHAAWIGPPTTRLGENDHGPETPRVITASRPLSEATPPLTESLRGPLVSARARIG